MPLTWKRKYINNTNMFAKKVMAAAVVQILPKGEEGFQ